MSSAVDVVTAMASGRKASQLYPSTHPSFVEAINLLVSSINDLTAAGPFTLNVHQGHLYHQSTVIGEDTPGVTAIEEAFESRRIESMTMQPGFSRPDAIGLLEVLGLRPSPSLDAEAELADRGVRAVTLAFLADEDDGGEERDRVHEQDRALYRRLIATLRTLSAQTFQGALTDLGNAESMVDGIMSRILEDRSAVLGLATMQEPAEADLFHSINVMIYSLALGATLGLPEEGLSSLGMAAMTHDIGKTAFDHSDPEHIELARLRHPAVGAEILSRIPERDPSAMLVAYEHHMHVDGGGFPERPSDYVGHPFSRMVAIANRYANLVNPQAETEPLTPDEAIAHVLREAGSLLDPMFARLFAKALGAFPVGCVVRLSDQSVGIVSKTGEDILQPTVHLVYDSGGIELESPRDLDLVHQGLSIIEVVKPENLNVTVADHL